MSLRISHKTVKGGEFTLPLLLLLLLLLLVLLLTACGVRDEDGEVYELPPEPEEGVLVYAALNSPVGKTQSLVDAFNASHTDVQIEIRDYSDENGPQRLMVELAAGRVPDMMELYRVGEGENADNSPMYLAAHDRPEGEYFLPYQRMAQMGYLEDLWPYIENDPELGREDVLEAPLKAAEVNGGLYMLFEQVSVTTMVAPEELVGERFGWTMEEMQEAFAALPAGSTILPFDTTRREAFVRLFCTTLNRYVDWEEGACSFDSGEFRAVLEFLKTFPEEFETTLTSLGIEKERTYRRLDGEQLLEPTTINTVESITLADSYFGGGGRVAFVGYPTPDRSAGSFFNLHGKRLAMSSACRDKEAAWEFMRHLITKNFSSGSLKNQAYSIFINRLDYEQATRRSMSKNTVHASYWQPYRGGPRIFMRNDGCPDENDLHRYETLISSTTQIYWPDYALSDLVWDVCGPYFAGDKTLDDTIRLLNNRVGLYINEQK